MIVTGSSKVVAMANGVDFRNVEGYLAAAVTPTLCETAVLIAAVSAGAAVAACAAYAANAWAANRHGHYQHQENVESLRGGAVTSGSLAELVDARVEIIG